MAYYVKELFYSLQGEGAQAGRAAVFCRFSGCNLWSGLEKDKQASLCPFCDTDFVGIDGEGGGRFNDAVTLLKAIIKCWPDNKQGRPYVVFTGGEPLLQLDSQLIGHLHDAGFEVAVETNGTLKVPDTVDWICVSPKAVDNLVQTHGQEIKLLYPLSHLPPEQFEQLDFEYYFLQAVDDCTIDTLANNQAVTAYCLQNPKWRVSLQTHKLLNIK